MDQHSDKGSSVAGSSLTHSATKPASKGLSELCVSLPLEKLSLWFSFFFSHSSQSKALVSVTDEVYIKYMVTLVAHF